jgi:hypothetical protein
MSLVLVLSLLAPGLRDHGPGTSGGGVSTQSGETLKPGAVAIGLSFTFTSYERLSASDINSKTLQVDGHHPHFDAVRWSLLETVELSYGATEDIQIGWSVGYYRANDVREGHVDGGGTYEFHEFGDVSGQTDQWISAKFRLSRGPGGHFSVLTGIKLPTGDDDETDESGTGSAALEPSLQPGSGTFDVMGGVAYSVWLSERVTLDTSAQYTYRTKEDAYKIGDLTMLGMALAYRLVEDAASYPQSSVFLEINARHLQRHREHGNDVHNSGGLTLFATPGLRIGLSKNFAFTLGVAIPFLQHLHDEQQETKFKALSGITLSF